MLKATFKGRAVHNGEPVPGLQVYVRPFGSIMGMGSVGATTGADGTFSITLSSGEGYRADIHHGPFKGAFAHDLSKDGSFEFKGDTDFGDIQV